jgi:hypothetical protein
MASVEESEFEGIWYPTFVVDKNQMFLSQQTYLTTADLLQTTLVIVISETPFYIKNHQSPITKKPEVIFHNLLFTIVCLEIFGLVFLLFKLLLIPVFEYIQDRKNGHGNGRIQPRNIHVEEHARKEERWATKPEHRH